MKKRMMLLAMLVLVAACGGGGTDNQSTPTTPAIPSVPGDGGSTANDWLTFSPSMLEATSLEGDSVSIAVEARSSKTISEPINIRVEAPAEFQPDIQLETLTPTNYRATLRVAPTAKAGLHTGYLKVYLCLDSPLVCNKPYPGSPWYVPYQLKVVSTAPHLTPLSRLEGASSWNNAYGNAGFTGYVPTSITLDPTKITLRWKTPAGYSTLVAEGGFVFLQDKQSNPANYFLRAIREENGTLAWEQEISPWTSNLVSAQGRLFMLQSDLQRTLQIYDIATGASQATKLDFGSYNHLTADTNAIYIRNPLQRWDILTKISRQISSAHESISDNHLAIHADHLYTYDINGLTRYRIDNGTVDYLAPHEAPIYERFDPYTVVVDGADRIFTTYSAGGSVLSRYSATDRKRLWTTRATGEPRSLPAVAPDTLYIVTGNAPSLQARSTDSGALLWSVTLPDAILARWNYTTDYQVVIAGNLLFVSSIGMEGKATYAIDRNTHQVAWSIPATGHLAISENGILYIARPNSALVAVNLR